MIVGTAGHIDHGKTSLVKALTGVDTDRLKEEKARGISIELGYAYLPLAEGGVLGFVDVPGHEKFVDHMVAGATGIDFALLVVAADDGPMPQTVEHLDIVQLLDVRRGAVAMTKIDRCDPPRLAECEQEIRSLLRGTGLADAPVIPVSSATGSGVEALRAHLARSAAGFERGLRRGAGFRLAVDRCFTLDGVGTVVTGTVHAGRIGVGDQVRITPAGMTARVRSIHAQNRGAQAGQAGERCALALAGPEKASIARGDWVVAPRLHAPTQRFDARLSLSGRETRPLRHWSPAHLHLGAAHVMARVAMLEGEQLEAGASGLVQIVTDSPIGALSGDAFIVRDAAATRTIGGGRVLDPFGPARRRKAPARIEMLKLMEESDPGKRLAAMLAWSRQGVDIASFCVSANVSPDEVALDPSSVRVRDGDFDHAFGRECWAAHSSHLLDRMADYHAKRPDELGPDPGQIRRMWFPQLGTAVIDALVAALVAEKRLARTGSCCHLPAHSLGLSAREQVLARGILPLLEAGGYEPPWVRDLVGKLKASEQEVRSLLARLARRGEVYQVVKDLFYSRSTIAKLAASAKALHDRAGMVRAAEFRDSIGVGRKRAIQILEFFDRVGYTRRTNDEHRIRTDSRFRPGEPADSLPEEVVS